MCECSGVGLWNTMTVICGSYRWFRSCLAAPPAHFLRAAGSSDGRSFGVIGDSHIVLAPFQGAFDCLIATGGSARASLHHRLISCEPLALLMAGIVTGGFARVSVASFHALLRGSLWLAVSLRSAYHRLISCEPLALLRAERSVSLEILNTARRSSRCVPLTRCDGRHPPLARVQTWSR